MSDAEGGDRDAGTDGGEERDGDPVHAVILDYLAHGRPEDDRPQYEKSPVAYALGERDFRLVELEFGEEADVGIGDRVVLDPPEDRERVTSVREVEHEDLSNAARSELEYVVEDVVERHENRFVDFYNDAQPITLRLHQLNLLPGIGKKLRNNVLDERKRKPFADFEDMTDRVSGLHDPAAVLVDRIMEELRDDDLKYRIFVRPGEERD